MGDIKIRHYVISGDSEVINKAFSGQIGTCLMLLSFTEIAIQYVIMLRSNTSGFAIYGDKESMDFYLRSGFFVFKCFSASSSPQYGL